MTDQPNPYSQPKEGSGVPIGEAKTSTSKRRVWFVFLMVFVVPLALIGLYVVVTFIHFVFLFNGWGV